jgi:hypothetical protein
MTWGWTRRVRLVRGEGQDVPGWYGVRDAACPLGTRGGEGGGGLVRLGQQRVQRPRPDERVQRACEPAHPDRVDRVSARLRARRRVRPLEPLLSTGRLGRQWSRYSIGSVVTLQYRVSGHVTVSGQWSRYSIGSGRTSAARTAPLPCPVTTHGRA